jgi:hypothetical protein
LLARAALAALISILEFSTVVYTREPLLRGPIFSPKSHLPSNFSVINIDDMPGDKEAEKIVHVFHLIRNILSMFHRSNCESVAFPRREPFGYIEIMATIYISWGMDKAESINQIESHIAFG